jgi:hypothetical protein
MTMMIVTCAPSAVGSNAGGRGELDGRCGWEAAAPYPVRSPNSGIPSSRSDFAIMFRWASFVPPAIR